MVSFEIFFEVRERRYMASQDILERARKGDPRVIAAMLNRVLNPLGVRSQAARRDRTLHIVCSGDLVPDAGRMTALVRKLVDELGMQSIEQIRLYGQKSGEESVAWKHNLAVTMEPEPTTSMTNYQPDAPEMHPPDETSPPSPVESPVDPLSSAPGDAGTPAPMAAVPSPEPDPFPAIAPMTPEPVAAAAPTELERETLADALVMAEASSGDEPEISRLLQRPEAVVLLFLLVLATLWDLYLDLADSDQGNSLSGARLAARLGVNPSTVSRRKNQDEFSIWSQKLDPDGIAWVYQNGRFMPLDDSLVVNP
jgi:hypothetical protein